MQTLSDVQFEKFRKFIYNSLGINLSNAKREMLQAKLRKLMGQSEMMSFDDYFNLIAGNTKNGHWTQFVNEITIHKTDFFREDNHFNYLTNKIDFILNTNPRIANTGEIRVWSSACSTGEEPYTIAMVLKECLPPLVSIKLLATDISPGVVKEAQEGIYPSNIRYTITPYYLTKYFKKIGDEYEIIPEIRDLITFRTFNLMDSFPFKNTFDIIFCRNVMIYFDFDTQEKLIKKFYDINEPNGLLFIGHSESLTQKQYKYKYLEPTIYIK